MAGSKAGLWSRRIGVGLADGTGVSSLGSASDAPLPTGMSAASELEHPLARFAHSRILMVGLGWHPAPLVPVALMPWLVESPQSWPAAWRRHFILSRSLGLCLQGELTRSAQ